MLKMGFLEDLILSYKGATPYPLFFLEISHKTTFLEGLIPCPTKVTPQTFLELLQTWLFLSPLVSKSLSLFLQGLCVIILYKLGLSILFLCYIGAANFSL